MVEGKSLPSLKGNHMNSSNSLVIFLIVSSLVSGCIPATGPLILGASYIMATRDTFENSDEDRPEMITLSPFQKVARVVANRKETNPLCKGRIVNKSDKIKRGAHFPFKVIPVITPIKFEAILVEEKGEDVVVCSFVTGCIPVSCK